MPNATIIEKQADTQVETDPTGSKESRIVDIRQEDPDSQVILSGLSGLTGLELEQAVIAAAKSKPGSCLDSPRPQRLFPNTWSARDLIALAKTKPPVPIIEGLLNEGDILLLHGTEESFKSVMVVQCAEAIATGTPFLRKWPVPSGRRVGIIETEMHAAMMGKRLTTMFPSGDAPEHIYFMDEELLRRWRREGIPGKFTIIEDWIGTAGIQVLKIDTANDFFRGADSPSDERHVGEFFDKLRSLDLQGRIIVRHDRKRREIDSSSHSNELIRGSAEWKEDPEAIIHLKRMDKRTHQVEMEVGKLRYGSKPEPCKLWFDTGTFRLVPLPPVIAALESGLKTRQEILTHCERFGLKDRAVDEQIQTFRGCFKTGQSGHEKTYEIDLSKCTDQEWYPFLVGRR